MALAQAGFAGLPTSPIRFLRFQWHPLTPKASGKFLESRLWVDLEAHGRDTNFAHTIGWFTELKAVEMVKHEPLPLQISMLGL